MKTVDKLAGLAQAASDTDVATHGARRNADRTVGVVAVVIERDDGTGMLYCRGSGGTWPTAVEAKHVVARVSRGVVWHETTPGVWVGRAGESKGQAADRGTGRTRRPEPPSRPRVSPDGETYLAALVLRGIVGSGNSRGIPRGPENVSDVREIH